MHYYNPENREPLGWAVVALVAYFALGTVLMFCVNFTLEQTSPADQGILVQFGESESGAGEEDLLATDVAATPPTPQEQSEEQLLTDEREEIAMEASQEREQTKAQKTQEEESQEKRDTVVEERVVNQMALFSGRKADSKSASKGENGTEGNQGSQGGKVGGATEGGGDDGSTLINASFDLKNRTPVGSIVKPKYNVDVEGRVVISITVDELGKVTSASYQPKGSTTTSTQLVEAAVRAAKKTKFSKDDNVIQGGTITYIFKMQ